MQKAEAKEAELKGPSNSWKASDCISVQETILSMAAQLKQSKESRNDASSKRNDSESQRSVSKPPFHNSKGKLGDTKKHKGKTYYYCPNDHKVGHWVTHHPSKCKSKPADSDKSESQSRNTSSRSNSQKVSVDPDKMKYALQTIIEQNPTNVDTATNAFTALIQE